MTDHPRLTRYIPTFVGTDYAGMYKERAPGLYVPEQDPTHGPYVLAVEADAEIDRLRAEVERLTQERSTVARNPYADQNRALVAEIAARRGIVQGCPCGCRGDFYLTESDPYNVQGT